MKSIIILLALSACTAKEKEEAAKDIKVAEHILIDVLEETVKKETGIDVEKVIDKETGVDLSGCDGGGCDRGKGRDKKVSYEGAPLNVAGDFTPGSK